VVIRVTHVVTIDWGLHLIRNQLLDIQQSGYDVSAISSPGPRSEDLERSGVRHFAIRMTRSITPLQDLYSLWNLYRLMKRERFTIVHTHNPKPGLIGQLAARAAGVPIVVNTVHGYYFHPGMRPLLRRLPLRLPPRPKAHSTPESIRATKAARPRGRARIRRGTMANLIVAGAAGRMGRLLTSLIAQDRTHRLVGALEAREAPAVGNDAGTVAGVGSLGVPITADYAAIAKPGTVTLDFTIASAALEHLEVAAKAGAARVSTPAPAMNIPAVAMRTFRILLTPDVVFSASRKSARNAKIAP